MAHASLALLALSLAAGKPSKLADFSHQFHIETAEAACKVCHDVSTSSGRPVTDFDKGCKSCHEDGYPAYNPLPKLGALAVEFPHRAHAEKMECTVCHSGIPTDKIVAGAPVMGKDRCFACHAEKNVPVSMTACVRCHGENRKLIRPADHGGDWLLRHGSTAAWRIPEGEHGKDCKQCHGKSACTECHDQMAPGDHTGLWRARMHGLAAQWDRDRCKTCHETGTCVRCHQQTEPMNHAGPWKQVHGLVAGSRDSESCAVCHRTSECAACHAGNRK